MSTEIIQIQHKESGKIQKHEVLVHIQVLYIVDELNYSLSVLISL